MKKRVYFMVSSILSFILSAYSIVMANDSVKQTIDSLRQTYSGFPEDFQNRVISIYENSGVKIIILFAILVMIASVFMFIFALNNTLLKHKGLVITFTVLSFLLTDE